MSHLIILVRFSKSDIPQMAYMNKNELDILRFITTNAPVNKKRNYSFSALKLNFQLTNEELDTILHKLEIERLIDQIHLKSHDDFIIVLRQKSVDTLAHLN
jgi:hypothetical protein